MSNYRDYLVISPKNCAVPTSLTNKTSIFHVQLFVNSFISILTLGDSDIPEGESGNNNAVFSRSEREEEEEESKMEKNYSHPENIVINLKQLPPIDPFRIMNTSFNVMIVHLISLLCALWFMFLIFVYWISYYLPIGCVEFFLFFIFQGKLSKSSTRAPPKVVKSSPDEALRKSRSGSDSSSKRSETRGNTTSRTGSVDEGTELAREDIISFDCRFLFLFLLYRPVYLFRTILHFFIKFISICVWIEMLYLFSWIFLWGKKIEDIISLKFFYNSFEKNKSEDLYQCPRTPQQNFRTSKLL